MGRVKVVWNNPNPRLYKSLDQRVAWQDSDEAGHGIEPETASLNRLLRHLIQNQVFEDAYRGSLRRYIEKKIGGIPVLVTEWYGWAMYMAAASGVLFEWQSFKYWWARQVYDVPDELYYYPPSEDFLNVQRAYLNSTETVPNFYFCLVIGALEHPRFCALCGFVWVFGRWIYARAHYKGRAWLRKNGAFHVGGQAGLYICTVLFTIRRMTMWFIHKSRFQAD